jgi:hypothetical protein
VGKAAPVGNRDPDLEALLTELGGSTIEQAVHAQEPIDAVDESKAKKRAAYRQRLKLRKEAGLVVGDGPVSSVFVTNLHQGTTAQLLADTFRVAGQLAVNADSTPKVKLYYDATAAGGKFKGEALVTYLRAEAVEGAVQMFNDSPAPRPEGVREDRNMQVQRAKFESRGQEKRSM